LDDLSNVRLSASASLLSGSPVRVTQVGAETGLASFVDQFLEHEKSWLKLQSESTQFVARLSQTPIASPLDEGQDIKGE
jgi:hypothetical protein